jgi:hypothetical protein
MLKHVFSYVALKFFSQESVPRIIEIRENSGLLIMIVVSESLERYHFHRDVIRDGTSRVTIQERNKFEFGID